MCQMYGYHDCAMEILTCVMELFASDHSAAGANSTHCPLLPHIDERRYCPTSPPTDDRSVEESTRPRPQRAPVKPASLPSLQLSDNEPRHNKKRHKRWANSRTNFHVGDLLPKFHHDDFPSNFLFLDSLTTSRSDGQTVGLPWLATLTANLVILLQQMTRNDKIETKRIVQYSCCNVFKTRRIIQALRCDKISHGYPIHPA